MRFPAFILLLIFTSPALSRSLAGSVDLFVYPANDQSKQQQEQDDYQCFTFAKEETNFDPVNAREPSEVVADNPGMDGSGARGAFRGVARGALLGEIIDDDAGKGAAIGGAMGMMRARNRSRQDAQRAAASKNSENQSSFEHQKNNFKKAMSICLEARGYTVK